MIIIRLRSGLGNQMFQYAFFKQMQQWHGKDNVKLDIDTYIWDTHNGREIEKVFPINFEGDTVTPKVSLSLADVGYKLHHRILRRLRGRKHNNYRSWNDIPFEEYSTIKEDIYLEGFWNEEKFFAGVKDELLKIYTFDCKLSKEHSTILNNILSSESVGIHVRRGDYHKYPDKFPMCTPKFYKQAVDNIRLRHPNIQCFVFSDDIEWCKSNLNFLPQVTFVENKVAEEAYKDMMLMSKCKHNIIANSTFSWWGAWLNKNPDKIVLYPDTVKTTYASMPDKWEKLNIH